MMSSDETHPIDAIDSQSETQAQRRSAAHTARWREVQSLLPPLLQGIRVMVVLLILCGVIYPALVLVIGQAAFSGQANGSLVNDSRGNVVGSNLIGQEFTSPYYFHGRPSVTGYNASASGGSNLGPTNPALLSGNGTVVIVASGDQPPSGSIPVPGKAGEYIIPGTYLGVAIYAAQFRAENGLPSDTPLPADIVTASGSGLDPDISIAAAELQINRIFTARRTLGDSNADITLDALHVLISRVAVGRQLGVLGEPYVNVLALNLALDAKFGSPAHP